MTTQEIVALIEQGGSEVMSGIIKDQLQMNENRDNEMKALYQRYEQSKVPVQERTFDDTTKVNRKLAHDYPGLIVDTKNGYFLGHPIGYTIDINAYLEKYTQADYNALESELKSFKTVNNIEDLDSTTGEYASVCGMSGRLLYFNIDGELKVMNVKPYEVAFIYDGTTEEMQYAMIYYNIDITENGKTVTRMKVEWYDKTNVSYYIQTATNEFILDPNEKGIAAHGFDYVPVIKFVNNNSEKGDFEKVEELIDAYDFARSDVQNEVEEFRIAYLGIWGAEPTEEDIKKFRQTGCIAFPDGTKGEFITKNFNGVTQFIENHEDRLNEDIFRFSKAIDMTDDKFAGNSQSGASRRYKLIPLENDTINKERKFIKGLREMFKVIQSAWSKLNIKFDYEDMGFTFKTELTY